MGSYIHENAFSGQAAIVTGGAGGMGRAIALAFAATGASVVVADIDSSGGSETVRLIRQAGGTAEFAATDVSKSADVATMVTRCTSLYGRIDCAVNAAAIEFEDTDILGCSEADFDRMISVNLKSVFLCMKSEIAAMLETGNGGAIVNIASTNSFRPQPHQTAYTASKHGVLGLTKAVAIDFASRGIRVNAIAPGSIDTPMLRNAMERRGRNEKDVISRLSLIGRFGVPEEIARAALWLCSEDSSFTIGHTLAVDGGYLAR